MDNTARNIDLAKQAYWLLRTEFDTAIAEDACQPVSTPCASTDEQRAVDVVAELLATEPDNHTLLSMLRVVATASEYDTMAQGIIRSLGHRFATQHSTTLQATGALG